MGFILTEHNEIVFRDDSLTHDQRKQIAEKVNARCAGIHGGAHGARSIAR
jgi:hypothetical protein